MWANLHLLFWLSLIPFVTSWMGENHFAALPTALYGVVLLMNAIAYLILQHTIVIAHGRDSGLAQAVSVLEGVDDIAVVRLTSSDVVRHRLVSRIVDAYEGLNHGR